MKSVAQTVLDARVLFPDSSLADLYDPLTSSGRQRKIGRAMGCCAPAAFLLVGIGSATYGAAHFLISILS